MDILSTLSNYDVQLERLTESKLELVRSWRNDPEVSQFMLSQNYITQEQQLKWFNKINNDNNLYYLVLYRGEYIGLVDMNDIDYDNKCGENGFYIALKKYQNFGVLAFQVLYCLYDYWFGEMNMDYVISRIMHTNPRASRMAEYLGCVKYGDPTDTYQEYRLYKDNYFSNENRKRLIRKYNK